MSEYVEFPDSLLEGSKNLAERAARIGRLMVLRELGFFDEAINLDLAKGHYKGRFNAGVRKRFAGINGNTAGCSVGDIEVAAELTDMWDAIYDFEQPKTT